MEKVTLQLNLKGLWNEREKILDDNAIQSIAEDIGDISIKEIFSSKKKLKIFIENGLSIINALEKVSDNETLQQLSIKLFNIVIKMREYFTQEKYILNVETQEEGTIEADLQQIFEDGAIAFNSGQFEYNLNKMQKYLKNLEIHQKIYNNLTNRIFKQAIEPINKNNKFIYKNSDATTDVGSFFEEHFANYQSQKNSYIAHYYIKTRHLKKAVYTRASAKYYNRGHVYEWYIEDLNNGKIEEASRISPEAFMNQHKKDNVAFIKAGDITRQKGEQIEAVQIKRFNNVKLLTCTQLKTVLYKLNKLTSSQLTEEKAKKIIKQTFFSSQNKNKLQRQSSKTAEKAISQIFQNWQTF